MKPFCAPIQDHEKIRMSFLNELIEYFERMKIVVQTDIYFETYVTINFLTTVLVMLSP